jgi:hypothetical protein
VELNSVAEELYGLKPQEFTVTRDARVAEARQAGDKELAASLKKLRKPSVGAWMANMLVRERPADIVHLISLGEELRRSSLLDGEQIRSVSKKKQDAVTKLLRHATSIAKRAGQPVSHAAAQDLEATLDAAFGDPSAAASLREGCLTTTLRYSGLGFASDGPTSSASTTRRSQGSSAERKGSTAVGLAKSAFELTTRAAEEADAELATAQRAITAAEAELKRLRAAATVADRRATKAHDKASAAKKRLDTLKHTSDR